MCPGSFAKTQTRRALKDTSANVCSYTARNCPLKRLYPDLRSEDDREVTRFNQVDAMFVPAV